MANIPSEYKAEYCGFGGARPSILKSTKDQPAVFPDVRVNYDKQPVGGRAQAAARQRPHTCLPVYDSDLVTTVYSGADQGTHRIAPYHWRDSRWSDPQQVTNTQRIDQGTLYHPEDRDPTNRPNFYVYRSTLVDALDTPCRPLTVPDVHKLRYMHNDYMSYDDWY